MKKNTQVVTTEATTEATTDTNKHGHVPLAVHCGRYAVAILNWIVFGGFIWRILDPKSVHGALDLPR